MKTKTTIYNKQKQNTKPRQKRVKGIEPDAGEQQNPGDDEKNGPPAVHRQPAGQQATGLPADADAAGGDENSDKDLSELL